MAEKPTYQELERRVQELETDYSQLEKKLQEAHFFSEEIMRYMTEGLVLTDVRENVIFINQRLSEMLGYLPEEIIGKCWLDMVPAEQQVIAHEAQARRVQGHADRYEIILRHKDGHKFPVLIGAGPRFNKQRGEFIGTMGVVNDITDRKQAEDALNRKHIMLARTEAVAHVGSWEWEAESDKVTWSEELFRIFGLEPMEEAPPFAEHQVFYVPEDRARLVEAVQECLRNSIPYDLEVRINRTDGQLRNCVVRGIPEHGADGSVNRLYGSLHDITERKRAEEKLENIKLEFQSIFDNSYVGIMVLREGRKLAAGNPRLADIFGYENPEEMVGLSMRRLHLSEEKFREFGENYYARLSNSEQFQVEYQLRRKDGSPVWCSLSGRALYPSNLDHGVIWVIDDITHRKQAEEALHKSEERFSLAMEASKDGIWDWDLTTGYIYCSPALTSMLGYDSKDVIEHVDQWQNLIHPEDRQKTYQINLDCVNNLTDSFEIEYRMKTSDGCWKWILGRGRAACRDVSGRAVRVIGTHQDITERKQTEDALKASELWLGETMRIARVGGWKIDLLGNTLEWTDETFRIHELPIGDPPNVDEAILFYHAEDRPWVSTAVQHAVANGEGFDFEARIITAKQNLIWVRSIGHASIHEGRMVLVWGMIQDITERKLAEEALRDSEAKFRSYIEHAPLGVFVADAQGRYIEVSPSAERITSYTVEQLTSMSIPDLLVPENREDGLKHFQALIDTGQSYGETAFRRADGSIGYWNVSATRLGPDRYLGFVEDITERKEREERIALLGHMLDHAPAGVTIHNTEGHFLFSNRQNMLMHGYEREEEFLALNLHQIDLPESEAMLAERFRKIFEEGEARFEVAHFRKDGSIIELEVTAKTIDWYGQIAILSIAIDISERKRVEKELKAERDQIFSLFNSIDEIIYIADPQTHELLYINRHLASLLPENGIGKKCYKVLQNFDSPCSFCTNDIIFGNMSEPHRWEYYNPFLDQHYAIIDRVIHWSDGRDVRFEMAVDISGIKEAEAEKEKLQAHLLQAQKMESVGRLAGGVAHDFNNMLGVILGHAEFALEKAAENHDLYTDLKEIQTAAQRSADLTRQLLTFARKQIIDPRKLDLNHTVENMLSMLRRLIGEDIDLSWEPARKLWPVKMDSSQVDQILANLCVNARDAIAGVGKLTIETGMISFDEAYCKDYAGFIPGDFVMIAVSDDGCGMDKETLNNLFEPFFTTKEVGKGTGLGLATIYGIVKQNNGFINVYSEPGQGTTFRIYLPRYSAANETHEVIQPEKPAPTGNETILLVEDEPAILNMTRMMLERKGYSVLFAASPAEAIDMAKAHADKIHLIMTDVVMPEMNGRDLSSRITALYPDIKLLFMSGYTANVIAHQGVLDEGVAFIQKPFSMKDLAVKVREVLDMAPDKTQR